MLLLQNLHGHLKSSIFAS